MPSVFAPLTAEALGEGDGVDAHSYLHGQTYSLWENALVHNLPTDGTTNAKDALDDAVDATPDGGTLMLPPYKLRITSTWTVDKRINVVGMGPRSTIWVDVGTGNDGIVFDTGTLIGGAVIGNFAVAGPASACKDALVFRNFISSSFRDIWVQAGATWGARFDGCLINDIRTLYCTINWYLPHAGSVMPTNGVLFTDYGAGPYPPNANKMHLVIEGLAGKGLEIITAQPDGGNNWISGIIESIIGDAVRLQGCSHYHVGDLHLEGTGSGNTLRLVSCGEGVLGPGLFVANDVVLESSARVELAGVYCNNLSIDASTADTFLRKVVYGINGGSVTDLGARTRSSGQVYNATGVSLASPAPVPWDARNLVLDGGFEKWSGAGTPLGGILDAGTLTQTGTGLGDTRKLFGSRAIKITGSNSQLRLRVPLHLVKLALDRFITATVWLYIPSGQGANQPTPYLSIWFDGGVTAPNSPVLTTTNEWKRIALRALVPAGTLLGDDGTYIDLAITNGAPSGDYYVDGASIVIGDAGPTTIPPYVEDTALYRSAAGLLKTDDRLVAAGGVDTRVVATGSLPAAGAGMDGHVLIEDAGAGDRNLIIYAGGQRFRIDGGANV